MTGAAGFIGYHISKKLLDEGWRVIGLDCISDYYDVSLKLRREDMLLQSPDYRSIHEKVEAPGVLLRLFEEEKPNAVIHLAAQAGVRYSIENPRAYLESNIVGTFELLEAARAFSPDHMLLASTSSAYGANKNMPYKETDRADHQMSFYAATKKSTESMAHSYSHLFNIPVTMFRFFTVYGPWGRPDMAYFKFTKSIQEQQKIYLHNFGNHARDFTYIDDCIECIVKLISLVNKKKINTIVNIAGGKKINIKKMLNLIEKNLNIKAKINYKPLQFGDVKNTFSNPKKLKSMINYKPKTSLKDGIKNFCDWYKKFYR